jgi:hypothetical protein
MITKQSLLAKKEDIVRQRDNAFAVHQQAIGALALIDHLIELATDEDGLSLDELAKSLGADSAEISPIE